MNLSSSTAWRITTVVCMFMGYSMYYVGRKSFTNVMPFLLLDGRLGLQKEHLGTIASAFMVFYSVSKFLSGVLSDKLSPRLVFCIGLVGSGIVNCLFGLSANVWLFTLLWCINGVFQGLGWPPCAKLIGNWFRPTEAGTVWSIVTASGNVSSSLAPLIATIMATVFGWHAAFFCCGVLCVAIALPISVFLKDTPAEAGLQEDSQESLHIARKGQPSQSALSLLTSPFMQLVGFSYMIISITKTALEDWEQLFLIQSKRKNVFEASYAASFFQVGAIVGNLLSGVLSDWCMRKFGKTSRGSPRLAVLILMCVLMLASVTYLHYFVSDNSSNMELAIVSSALGCGSYGPHAVFGLLAVENAPPGLSGTSHAIVAAMAGGGNVIAGLPFSYVFSHYGWDAAFFCLECCGVLAILVILLITTVSPQIGTKPKTK